MGWQACLTEIQKAAGVEFSDKELETILDDLIRRKNLARERLALGEDQAYQQAARELAETARIVAQRERATALQNLSKRVARREFVKSAPSARLGMEAKTVGVNTPFEGARKSVAAQGNALTDTYIGGFTRELDEAGLFDVVRSGEMDLDIAKELAELSRTDALGNAVPGKVGITKNEHAKKAAEIINRYQRLAVENLNKEGAWVGRYDGYVTRQTHSPDRIRRAAGRGATLDAAYQKWRDDTLPLLDAERTFDGADPEKFLRGVFNAFVTGVHLKTDGGVGMKDPAFRGPGNLAKRLSQERAIHFRDAESWMKYNDSYGTGTLAETVIRSLEHSARNTALMREFGTNPRYEFESDLQYLREKLRNTPDRMLTAGQERMLENQFKVLDGTMSQPVNRALATIGSITRWDAIVSKLGGVLLSSFGDVPLKASELRYQGMGVLEAYGDGLAAITRGRGGKGTETRKVIDLLHAGLEGVRGHIVSRLDASDTTPGRLSKISATFIRWTGLTYWTDAQRSGAELIMARHLGQNMRAEFAAMPKETQRVLSLYGVDSAKWDMIRHVPDPAKIDGRPHLTPDMAERIDDAAAADYLRKQGALGADAKDATIARKVKAFKEDLALSLQTYFTDRGEFAVLQPGARERAAILQGTQAGTPGGELLRAVTLFKSFPWTVISKAWGREIYGGQGKTGGAVGIAQLIAGSILFGYAAMTAKDLARGKTPRDPLDPKTWAAAFTQGGGAGIYGDFLMGDYNRFGGGIVETLAGPIFGTIGEAARTWAQLRDGSVADAGATALKAGINATPFINLFYTRMALDYLVLYHVQELISPGYVRRMERRMEKDYGQQFLISPSEAVR